MSKDIRDFIQPMEGEEKIDNSDESGNLDKSDNEKSNVRKEKKEGVEEVETRVNSKSRESSEDNVDEKTEASKQEVGDIEKSDSDDSSVFEKQIFRLKKDASSANSWAHQRNRLLVGGLNNLKNKVKQLIEDNVLYEEDGNSLLASFNLEEIEKSEKKDETVTKSGLRKLSEIEKSLKDELENYKKYTDNNDIVSNFDYFFDNLSVYDTNKRLEIYEYLDLANPVDGLKFVLNEGGILKEVMGDVVKEYGNVINYISSLKSEINKLKEKNSKLVSDNEEELKESQNYVSVKKPNKKIKNQYLTYEQLFSDY